MNDEPPIASLMPGATEIVCALGLEDRLVGVTFECDHPPAAEDEPVIVDTVIPEGLDSGEIDDVVQDHAERRESLYRIDEAMVRKVEPEILVTQTLCDVCAAARPELDAIAEALEDPPRVVEVDGRRLEAIVEDMEAIAEELGVPERGRRLSRRLEEQLAEVEAQVPDDERPRVASLEWLDPPIAAGHWMPDMVEAAGGREVLGRAGEHGRRLDWEQVARADPEVLVLMPCGFGAQRAAREARVLAEAGPLHETPSWQEGRVYAVDGGALFSRPGPRLVHGVEALAHALHPDRVPEAHPGAWQRVDPGTLVDPPSDPVHPPG